MKSLTLDVEIFSSLEEFSEMIFRCADSNVQGPHSTQI